MENEQRPLKPFLISLCPLDELGNQILFVNQHAGNKQNRIGIGESNTVLANLKSIDGWIPKNLFIGEEIDSKTKLEKDDFVIDNNGLVHRLLSKNLICETETLDHCKKITSIKLFTHKVIASNNPNHWEFGLHKIPESFITKFVKLQGYSTELTYSFYGRMKSGGKETAISFNVDYPKHINQTMMSWEELDIVNKQYLVNNILGQDDINDIDFLDIMEMLTSKAFKNFYIESTISKLPKKVFSTFEKDNASAYLDKIPKESLLILHKLLVEKMSPNQRKIAKNQLK